MPAVGTRPVRLALDDEPVDAASPWLQHKTTRRDVYLTRALRHPEADDVVLVNQRGELTETTTANLAVPLDGRWWTPPTTSGCLPGVERGRLAGAGSPARARAGRRGPARRRGGRGAQLAARLAARRGCSSVRGDPASRSSTRRWAARERTGRARLPVDRRLPRAAGRPHAAPGAGATAAVEAALSASLVAMVGRFTKDEEHADLVGEIVAAADAQRDACLEAAADDEAAFSAVAAAMKMPRGTAEEKEARRRRLSEVSLDATRPPLAVLASAAELVDLARRGAADRQPQPDQRRRGGDGRRPRRRHDGPAGGGGEPARHRRRGGPGRPGRGGRRGRGPGATRGRDRGRGAEDDAGGPGAGRTRLTPRSGSCSGDGRRAVWNRRWTASGR